MTCTAKSLKAMGENRFKHLCEPYRIGRVHLKNRIVKAPFCTVMADREGFVTDSLISCYETIAKGGTGLSIVEGTVVDPMGISGCPRLAVYDDKYIPGLTRLAMSVRRHCPVILQLQHAGPAYFPGIYQGEKIIPESIGLPVGASTLTRQETPIPEKTPPRALTASEIKFVESQFIRAADRAAKAQFNGIELHAAHQYLLNSFLSRAWNRRKDEYGGSIENRARLLVDIIQGIKKPAGVEFLVGVRLNGREYGSALGLTVREVEQIAVCLKNAGADYLSISGWGFGEYSQMCNLPEQLLFPAIPQKAKYLKPKFKQPGIFIDFAKRIKQASGLPVITVGRITPKLGEQALKENKADLIAFARSLIADPELPNKIRAGRIRDVAPCTSCLTCWDALEKGEHLRCRVNPAIGKEPAFAIRPAAKRKKIMVVGGGPAGLEAARIAGLRGHKVKLFEKGGKIGGLLYLASLIKGDEVEDLMAIVRYYRDQLKHAGVMVVTGKKICVDLVNAERPDAVVLSTGSKLADPVIGGLRKNNVLTSAALKKMAEIPLSLFGSKITGLLTQIWMPIGKHVVVVGGSMQGLEVAVFLLKRNRRVTFVTDADDPGEELPGINKSRILAWMKKQGAVIYSGARYESVAKKKIKFTTKTLEKRVLSADTVIVVSTPVPDRSVCEMLDGHGADLHIIGDAQGSGLIVDAISDGRRIGLKL